MIFPADGMISGIGLSYQRRRNHYLCRYSRKERRKGSNEPYSIHENNGSQSEDNT